MRNLPAALYKALGGFATNGVNMTKLESYMVERRVLRDPVPTPRSTATPRTSPLKRALEELAFFSKELHILGVFPAHPFREKIKEPG